MPTAAGIEARRPRPRAGTAWPHHPGPAPGLRRRAAHPRRRAASRRPPAPTGARPRSRSSSSCARPSRPGRSPRRSSSPPRSTRALRLHRAGAAVGPAGFAAATFGLTLATRLALNVFRGGPGALDQVFVVGPHGEGRTEFLPALPFLDGGVGHFLSHFTDDQPEAADPGAGPPAGPAARDPLPRHRHRRRARRADDRRRRAGDPAPLPARPRARRRGRGARPRPSSSSSSPPRCSTARPRPTRSSPPSASSPRSACSPGGRASRVLGAGALALAAFFSYALLAVGAWAALVRWRREGIGAALRLAALCAAVLVVALPRRSTSPPAST